MRRCFVSVRSSVFEPLAAVAHARSMPVPQVLAEMLDGWQPTPADAPRARLAAGLDAVIWIDAGLMERLQATAHGRGVSIEAVVEEALRGVP